jgi:hypothetical protein
LKAVREQIREERRRKPYKWICEDFENTDEITLSSLGVHFSLADAYTGVEFEGATGEGE